MTDEKENEMLKRHCMKFNQYTMIEFGAYVLYYTANPESKMNIPNCVYEKIERMYADWNKRCEIQNALKVLMENGKLFFEDYKGTISSITYCDFNNDKIIFKE